MNKVEELRFLILAAQIEGSRMFTSVLRPLGLTSSQSEVLRVLFDYEPLSLAELGKLLICETGSPSRLVNRMVEGGFIEQKKSETDSRKVTLTLTKKGRDAVLKIMAVETETYHSIETMLEGSSVSELIDVLWKFVDGKPTGNALHLRKTQKKNNPNR
ncbi:MarR family winged helix-turn-helix transcriptional regulator [Neobacillus sp. LXY-1]|uniref:MarR family winged helix-turn-helix transcriptional regulator n=1 Tax=Neobacillus sp. LXY-1 TaxID=3379133 RepID=UPI003EE361DA